WKVYRFRNGDRIVAGRKAGFQVRSVEMRCRICRLTEMLHVWSGSHLAAFRGWERAEMALTKISWTKISWTWIAWGVVMALGPGALERARADALAAQVFVVR